MRSFENRLLLAAEAIRRSDALLIVAGAGMSVDSGLPSFRGTDGFWSAYPPYRDLELKFSDLSSPQCFRENPRAAWGFYGHRLNLYRDTKPDRGFRMLKEWGDRANDGYFVFTSNVDVIFSDRDLIPSELKSITDRSIMSSAVAYVRDIFSRRTIWLFQLMRLRCWLIRHCPSAIDAELVFGRKY